MVRDINRVGLQLVPTSLGLKEIQSTNPAHAESPALF